MWPALRPQLVPAVLGAIFATVVLLVAFKLAPPELATLGDRFEIPLLAKLLYGGITEEVLMRWGLMTLLAWLAWRFFQKGEGAPQRHWVIVAAVLAALLFGLGHLPAVSAMGVSLTPSVVTFVVVGNTVPGLVFGLLYARRGLEAAMLAHAIAHGGAALLGSL